VSWITVAELSFVVLVTVAGMLAIRSQRLNPAILIPEAPEGARLVGADGTVVPLELVYAGKDHEGAHVWEATVVWRIGPGDPLPNLQVDRLPANTAISIAIDHP